MSDIHSQIDAFAFPDIIYYKLHKHYGYERSMADLLVREAKRYTYLVSQVDFEPVPSEEIDQAWHEMILLTKSYHRFCDTFCGGYVHHEPSSLEDMQRENYAKDVLSEYLKTQEVYQTLYREKCDKRAWTDWSFSLSSSRYKTL